MAKKTKKKTATRSKGTIVAKGVVDRYEGYLYFVDGAGNVRESKMNRKGGKRGRKVCGR